MLSLGTRDVAHYTTPEQHQLLVRKKWGWVWAREY